MKYYVVIDTNVIISALITKNESSPTLQVIRAMLNGEITPLYHEDMLVEYEAVLRRDKFHLQEETISLILRAVREFGIEVFPQPTGEIFVDMDDLIFYEVAMEKRDDDSYLVTGNKKHYPIRDFIVTPAEMISIMNNTKKDIGKDK